MVKVCFNIKKYLVKFRKGRRHGYKKETKQKPHSSVTVKHFAEDQWSIGPSQVRPPPQDFSLHCEKVALFPFLAF